jgi:hypothetical protein
MFHSFTEDSLSSLEFFDECPIKVRERHADHKIYPIQILLNQW